MFEITDIPLKESINKKDCITLKVLSNHFLILVYCLLFMGDNLTMTFTEINQMICLTSNNLFEVNCLLETQNFLKVIFKDSDSIIMELTESGKCKAEMLSNLYDISLKDFKV